MRVIGWGTALLALCFVAAASLVVIRHNGPGQPRVALTHAECGRGGGVVVVEVRNAGDVAVGPNLVVQAVVSPPQRHDGLVATVGQVVGARSLGSTLAPSASASVAIRLADGSDPCGERIHMVAAGASAPVSGATVNPPAYVEDFDTGTSSALTVVVNQVGARATWRVTHGQLEARGGGGALLSPLAWEDYDAEVRLLFPDGVDNDAALLFRAQNSLNWYQMRVDSTRVRLMAFVEGHLQTVGTWQFHGVRDGHWHRLKVEVRGRGVKGYVDGLPVFSHNGLLLSTGAVGVMQDDVRVNYDDLVVRPIVSAARRR